MFTTGAANVVNDSHLEDTQNNQNRKETDNSKTRLEPDVKIPRSVGKINMSSRKQRQIYRLGHALKRLIHEGNMDEFNKLVRDINDKLKLRKCVGSQMEISDIRFTALDAQIESRRLKYDTSLTENEILVQMEREIKFTSNPRVGSMVYLARHVVNYNTESFAPHLFRFSRAKF